MTEPHDLGRIGAEAARRLNHAVILFHRLPGGTGFAPIKAIAEHKVGKLILVTAVSLTTNISGVFSAIAQSDAQPAVPPKEWIDPDTGHRVILFVGGDASLTGMSVPCDPDEYEFDDCTPDNIEPTFLPRLGLHWRAGVNFAVTPGRFEVGLNIGQKGCDW